MKQVKRKAWAIVAQRQSDGVYIAYSFAMKKFQQKQISVFRKPEPSKGGYTYKPEAEFLEEELKKIKERVEKFHSEGEYKFFVTRVGSKHCPFKVDWGGFIKSKDRRPLEKYEGRMELLIKPRESKIEEVD